MFARFRKQVTHTLHFTLQGGEQLFGYLEEMRMLTGYELIKLQSSETDGYKCDMGVVRHNHAKVSSH